MTGKKFDISLNDTQATKAEPVKVSDFDFNQYRAYDEESTIRCKNFIESTGGVFVYRRMRVAEVFSYGCNDMKASLEWQLGSLQQSMQYESDIPNFLEPWFGIGAVAGSFGIGYIWNPGQAPAVKPAFNSIDEALDFDIKPVKNTKAGRHTLNMIEYFLEKTKGSLPMSMSDIQSPFNNATNIVDTSNFLISMITDPEKVIKLLDIIAELEIDFYREQEKLIGDALVRPGHGFGSSKIFEGFGMSDDNIVMIDNESYLNLVSPSFVKLGNSFGGPVHHSCGNFSDKTGMLTKISGLKMIDAAFTIETDPHPNPAEPFKDALSGTGIILNARMVGDPDVAAEKVKELYTPQMKVIVVTYCKTIEEQKQSYDLIHRIFES